MQRGEINSKAKSTRETQRQMGRKANAWLVSREG